MEEGAMNAPAEWAAGLLGLVNAGLAVAVAVPMRRARRAGRLGPLSIGNRAGLIMEIGLLVYALAALFRGGTAIAAAAGVGSAEVTLGNWGIISGSASVLLLLATARWFLAPLLEAVNRSGRALSAMLGAVESESLDPERLGLSSREQEVLAMIAAGKLSDQEIAEALFISPATAATHVRNILRKAGLHDRRQLVLLGFHDMEG
jgi:DNA-binding CsgD family transcriptional regulator